VPQVRRRKPVGCQSGPGQRHARKWSEAQHPRSIGRVCQNTRKLGLYSSKELQLPLSAAQVWAVGAGQVGIQACELAAFLQPFAQLCGLLRAHTEAVHASIDFQMNAG
jgi:hypothetical protein